MSFTDNDLKRLKDQLAGNAPTYGKNGGVDLDALLARLEAAEVCANHSQSCYGYKAWRKAAGK